METTGRIHKNSGLKCIHSATKVCVVHGAQHLGLQDVLLAGFKSVGLHLANLAAGGLLGGPSVCA